MFVKYSFAEAKNTVAYGGIIKKAIDNTFISKCANLTPSLTFKKVNSRYGYGGLVGYAEKGLTISESFSVTNINFNGKANAIGGLVGYYTYGGNIIKNSYSAGKITVSDDSTVTVGNIVGSGYYADASISKVDYSNVYSIFDDKDSETNPGDKWSKLLETGNWVVDPDVNNGMPVVKVVEKNSLGVSSIGGTCTIDGNNTPSCDYGTFTRNGMTGSCVHEEYSVSLSLGSWTGVGTACVHGKYKQYSLSYTTGVKKYTSTKYYQYSVLSYETDSSGAQTPVYGWSLVDVSPSTHI